MKHNLSHPVRAIREPFGTAGLIVAVCALVLALTGAAFAAGGLTKAQEKQVKKLAKAEAKRYAGKSGAAGATGPAGSAGPAGKSGDDGTNGTNGIDGSSGTDGETVTVKSASATECPEGGAKFSNATGSAKACNGSPWTAGGTLPKGKTETGMWAFGPAGAGIPFQLSPISFGIPLSEEVPTLVLVAAEHEHEAQCPGNFAEPNAAEGDLCLYVASLEEGATLFSESSTTSANGALLAFLTPQAGGSGEGSWAVTAK